MVRVAHDRRDPRPAPLFIALAFPAASARAAAPSDRPNIVVMLADDQDWGDLRIDGNTHLATPRFDSLARDGAMLDRFYVSSVCSPAMTHAGCTPAAPDGMRLQGFNREIPAR